MPKYHKENSQIWEQVWEAREKGMKSLLANENMSTYEHTYKITQLMAYILCYLPAQLAVRVPYRRSSYSSLYLLTQLLT